MKTVKTVLVCSVVASLLAYVIYLNWFTYESRSERLLSSFADPKENYAMLLDGVVTYEGDSVFFNLIAGVSFAISEVSEDIVLVKKGSTGESVEFSRKMGNDGNVPNPLGNGKFMRAWWTKADYYPDFDKKLQAQEEEFFAIFKKVVKNGQSTYSGFNTEAKLYSNFINTYKETPAKAKRLAEKVLNPLFSSRGM